ncbi:integrase [Nonlabens sp. YIK11]|uniref:tyrosine-type recombinase/integrase n=1 Tax=Nonlabens sp. YIK11 TaxID=1453349 RepID=UPI0006DC01AB|nr:tyrosine-type recombinase/integrase [Nonlabens sp. YIK11]KQC32678.1 integrase [Nonlabens sp. YIK11]
MFEDFKTLLQIKKYSRNTIRSYIGLLHVFQDFIGFQTPIEKLDNYYLFDKLGELILVKSYVYTTQKQLLSAIRLYLFEMHKREVDFKKLQPRPPQQVLPQILSLEEVTLLLNKTENKKHKAMLATIYGLGLRSGELINLKISDLDKNRNCVFISQSKGRKDRIVPYPDSLKPILKAYYQEYKPKTYLFEGQKREQYSAGSLRAVFNNACKRAGITKDVTCHNLRHSYATHLLDSGTNLRVIQNLLGHNNIKTTLLYTRVSDRSIVNTLSPLVFLKLTSDDSSVNA